MKTLFKSITLLVALTSLPSMAPGYELRTHSQITENSIALSAGFVVTETRVMSRRDGA